MIREEFVVLRPVPVRLMHLTAGGALVYLIDFHDPADPLFFRGGQENADMGNVVVPHDDIGAAAHDDEILLLCHVQQQLGFSEKVCVPGRQAVVTAEALQMLLPGQVLGTVGESRVAGADLGIDDVGFRPGQRHGSAFARSPLQHPHENFGIIVVDMQRIGDAQSHVVSCTAVGPVDADDQPVLPAEPVVQVQLIQLYIPFRSHQRAGVGCDLPEFIKQFVIRRQSPVMILLVLNAAGHVADQRQFAADDVLAVLIQRFLDDGHVALPVVGEHPSQRRSAQFVDQLVQIIQLPGQFPGADFFPFCAAFRSVLRDGRKNILVYFVLTHAGPPLLTEKQQCIQQEHRTQDADRPLHVPEEGRHADAVLVRHGLHHEVRGIADVGVGSHEDSAAGDGRQHFHRHGAQQGVDALGEMQGSGGGQEHHVGRRVVQETGEQAGENEHLVRLVNVHFRSQMLQNDQGRLHGDEDADEKDGNFLDGSPGEVVAPADFPGGGAEGEPGR